MRNKTLTYSVWLIVSISCLLQKCVARDPDLLGMHEMVNSLWTGAPGESGGSDSTTVSALDGMLILLNSQKLHRRQIPVTCPYCPVSFPCPVGCPNAPASPIKACGVECASTTGSPGPVGPPGVPGFPAPPLYDQRYGTGCPGNAGRPGSCFPGYAGPPGIPGTPGTCPRSNITNSVDIKLLHSTFRAHYQCNLPRQGCGYKIPDLLSRLNSLDSRLETLVGLKRKLQTVSNELSALRVKYIDNRRPGPVGLVGVPGKQGIKGMPGYEGVVGKCKRVENMVPLLTGRPGVPGPKGDPGIPGDKVCDCDGFPGDRGYNGLPGSGVPGEKGFKGVKGDQYVVNQGANGGTVLGITG